MVSRSKRTVPYPILGENTLVLSEAMVLTEENGELTLMFRVGDTCAHTSNLYHSPNDAALPLDISIVRFMSVGPTVFNCGDGRAD